jgi:hypothetical protein
MEANYGLEELDGDNLRVDNNGADFENKGDIIEMCDVAEKEVNNNMLMSTAGTEKYGS